MIPKFSQKSSKNFKIVLMRIEDAIRAKKLEIVKLSELFRELQDIFLEQILEAKVEGLDPGVTSTVQSTQTEIHRTLRLLRTDILFLQSSRKPETTEQRLGIIGDRIKQLKGYCQIIESFD
ncbi:MAG TPA: hypothetical protein DCF68_10015 [Cyanothece sp. UBA12306]|nr:hypothetical protein [Cyanothece sp. UBA12306]